MEYIKKRDAASWGILAGIITLTYFFFSDGRFSLIFTLAGMVQSFGFALIVLKIRMSRSVSGLSKETFICYAIIFALRSIIFIFYKVLTNLFRVIYLMTLQETPFSKYNKFQQLPFVDIFCMPYMVHSKQAITKTQTP